jgi:hypothetical protein
MGGCGLNASKQRFLWIKRRLVHRNSNDVSEELNVSVIMFEEQASEKPAFFNLVACLSCLLTLRKKRRFPERSV